MTVQVLNNIVAIYSIRPSELDGLRCFRRKVILPASCAPNRLTLVGMGKCSCVSSVESKSLIYTTTLSASLWSDPEISGQRQAFILETVQGRRFLIGSDHNPYPVPHITTTMPDAAAESSAYTLSLELSDTYGLREIVAV